MYIIPLLNSLSELWAGDGWQCQLVPPESTSPRIFVLADRVATPALALCAAALRARAANHREDER